MSAVAAAAGLAVRRRRVGPLAALAGAVLLAACARGPADRFPAGTLWEGDAAAARPLLRGLAALHDSPAAVVARDLDRRLAPCRRFLAFCPAGARCGLASALRCEPTGDLARQAAALRGDAGWLFVHRDAVRRLVAWGTARGDGAVAVHAELRDDAREAQSEPWEALLPAHAAPAPSLLATDGALVAMRLRSDRGAAPLRALTSGDWAGQLYSLKSELFLGMTLEGTSEVAVYPPVPGELIPPLALAVHVRDRARGERAMEELLAQLAQRWPVSREPWTRGTASGACLTDLNVLPGLAPCYLATERALVVGWNRRSVELALGGGGTARAATMTRANADAAADDSELLLRLDHMPPADALLRAAYGGDPADAPAYPWSVARLRGRQEGGAYRLDLVLLPRTSR